MNVPVCGTNQERLKDRFVKPLLQTEKSHLEHMYARHFSQAGHNRVFDMNISVLKFIKTASKSESAKTMHDRE